MKRVKFKDKWYRIVHNGDTKDDAICDGCAFQQNRYDECPNGFDSPLQGQCDGDNRIYIPATAQALAKWVEWKLDGFPIDVTTEDK